MLTTFAPVAATRISTYDRQQFRSALCSQAEQLGLKPDCYRGKRVVIKPNLVAPLKPDAAATTHPELLCAVVDFLRDHGAEDILLAESPGGIFSEVTLNLIYKSCGIQQASEECGLSLNYDTDAVHVSYPDGKVCHTFHILKAIAEADVIVDLCRLKAHSLTRMSGAVKNFFGVIPGIEKFEMHSTYPELPVFSEMLVDLCAMLCHDHEILAICDAVTAMEGNGPTGGTPRDVGAILMSTDPFSLDAAAEQLIGFTGTVPMIESARRRHLCPSPEELTVYGVSPKELTVSDFREPDTSRGNFLRNLPNLFDGKLARFFSPRPAIDLQKCIGCGVCADSCPRHTITLGTVQGKKRARIDHRNCIRCYCCQELCPIHAVRIHKNPIFRIIR